MPPPCRTIGRLRRGGLRGVGVVRTVDREDHLSSASGWTEHAVFGDE